MTGLRARAASPGAAPIPAVFAFLTAPALLLALLSALLSPALAETAPQLPKEAQQEAQQETQPEAPIQIPTPQPPRRAVPPEQARTYLTPEEFRAAFENRTAHLHASNIHYGSEYYLPGDRTIWVPDDGPCKPGVWTYTQGLYCFQYDNPTQHCWTVFESGGVIFAESVGGLLLEVYSVEERPLQCDPGLFSQAPDAGPLAPPSAAALAHAPG